MDTPRISRHTDLDGPVHYVDYGGDDDACPVLLVHGLGGSSVDWWSVGPSLAAATGRRVLAVDLPGFGRTPPAGRLPTIAANTAFLRRFVAQVCGAPVLLVGNSMGGMIGLHVAAEHPDAVTGLVLLDPAIPQHPRTLPGRDVLITFLVTLVPFVAKRALARRRLRATPEDALRETLALVCADPSRIPPDHLEAAAAFSHERATMAWADHALMIATRSLLAVLGGQLGYRRVVRDVEAPTLLVHGAEDRLVPITAAEATARTRLDWKTVVLDGVGHAPQVEVPQRVTEEIVTWLDHLPGDPTSAVKPGIRSGART